MAQDLYNIVLGVAGALGGFLLYAVWNAVKDLQEDDKKLQQNLSNLKEIVVGDYIKRAEMERVIKDMHLQFDKASESQSRHLEATLERFMKVDADSHEMIMTKLERLEQFIYRNHN